MLAQNLRASIFSEAVSRTFDGKHPCALCKEVAKGKESEKKSQFPPTLKKFEYSLVAASFTFTPPSSFYKVFPCADELRALTYAPAVPPPRSFQG